MVIVLKRSVPLLRIRDLENIFLSRKVAAHLLAGTAVGKGWDPACVPWTQQTVHSCRNVRKIMEWNENKKYGEAS